MTPDGLPILGKVPGLNNMYIATGHAMSGISMSLSTGSAMADVISTGKSEIDLTPFAADRFMPHLKRKDRDQILEHYWSISFIEYLGWKFRPLLQNWYFKNRSAL